MRSWESLVNNVDSTLTAFWGYLPKAMMGRPHSVYMARLRAVSPKLVGI